MLSLFRPTTLIALKKIIFGPIGNKQRQVIELEGHENQIIVHGYRNERRERPIPPSPERIPNTVPLRICASNQRRFPS